MHGDACASLGVNLAERSGILLPASVKVTCSLTALGRDQLQTCTLVSTVGVCFLVYHIPRQNQYVLCDNLSWGPLTGINNQ